MAISDAAESVKRLERRDDAAPAVSICNVSKTFRKHSTAKRSYSTVKSTLLNRIFGRARQERGVITALSDFSAQIPAGSAFGVIGRNGSGKSTLLKLIAGIYRPDRGSIEVNGRVSALIELGAGFHPDFTGRENVYLGATMYGLSRREIARRFDEIVCFAELEEFIDDPVRTYSSGMYMRLGFSVAVHTDPDILLVDEVLAVGDASFINRCHDKISDLRRRGKTLILVTHDLNSVVRWCDEALWLERGAVRERGDPRWVIDCYLQDVDEDTREDLSVGNAEPTHPPAVVEESSTEEPTRWGNGDIELLSVKMFSSSGEATWLFRSEEDVTVEVEYAVRRDVADLVFGVGILRADGVVVHGTNTALSGIELESKSAGSTGSYRYRITRLGLVPDSYFLDVAAHRSDGTPYDYHHLRHRFSVRSAHMHHGVYVPEHRWEVR